ncbi:MAG: site-2 protease family protein [Defluviitaleaceae bacterium]|nr:site-2 protease family protein [Defluviitaleaceae bacterium]
MIQLPTLQNLLINIAAAFVIVTAKEFTKALVSTKLGDTRPKRDKRLTLNPLKHIEIVGMIFIVLLGFGWGKPLETSSLHYKNRKRDILITHIVPSVVIVVLGMAAFFVLNNILPAVQTPIQLHLFLGRIGILGVSLALFNMIPIHPMDGAKILSMFLRPNQVVRMAGMDKAMLFILIVILLVWPGNPISFVISALTTFLLGLVV